MNTTVKINDMPHQFDAWVPPGLDAEPWDRLERAQAEADELRRERAENSAWSVAELEFHLQAERAGEPRPQVHVLPAWRADSTIVASWLAANPEGHVLLLPGKEEWAGKTVSVRVRG